VCRKASCKVCHALSITPLFHAIKSSTIIPAQVTQTNLAGNLFDRFHVRARNRIFQTGGAAADELPVLTSIEASASV
jgi:hypothetical protein